MNIVLALVVGRISIEGFWKSKLDYNYAALRYRDLGRSSIAK